MSTTPLTDSINALTTYANEVTGASDTTLSDAVYTLAQGYGQGGNIASGTVTLTETTTEITIDTNLSFTPKAFLIFADSGVDYEVNGCVGAVYADINFALVNSARVYFYTLTETRTTYNNCANVVPTTMGTITASQVTMPCRNSSYPWQALTYTWTAIG